MARIEPKLNATLGNHATKQVTGKDIGITRIHGQEEEVTLGGRRVALYRLYPPAAALYAPRMLEVLEEDFRRIPELIGRALSEPPPSPALEAEAILATATPEPAVQLGLF